MRITIAVVVLCLMVPPAIADTKTGKTSPNKLVTYEVFTLFGGQMNATLTWQKRSADLFVIMVCALGGEVLEWGVSASSEDRTQRLDTGVPFGTTFCLYGITSFSGASKFSFNVQESSDAFPRAATSGLRTGGLRKAPPNSKLIEMAERVRVAVQAR